MGLLDDFSEFAKTPEGQGLLAAVAGGMAGARKGAPINSLGVAGMSGLRGYSNAVEQGVQMEDRKIAQQYRGAQMQQMADAVRKQQEQEARRQGLRATLPEADRPIFDVAPDKYIERMPQLQAPKQHVVGGSLVETGPTGTKPIYTAPEKLPEWAVRGTDGNMSVNPTYLDMKKQIAAAGRSSVETKVFNNAKDDFKNERDLRNDFAGLPTTKAFNEVQSAHDQIQTALKTPSPVGDLAAATKIMKILDPGSVVRESELGMAMAATGALDRVQNYANMLTTGKKLTPSQREDFGTLATKLYGAAADRFDASAKEYQSVAKDYNLNPGRVAKPSQRSAIAPGGWSATVVK